MSTTDSRTRSAATTSATPPHEAPGGICLAYGDALEGPFTEYPHNPIVTNVWAPHYDVSHVSSPHVLWNADERELWLYFHGENTTTRLARSTDGNDFARRDHLGVFCDSRSAAPENGRAAAPSFGTDGGVPYMIYEAGERLEGVIALARG